MKLAAKYDIAAPAAFVFAQLADFAGWERAAMRHGADVMRTDTQQTVGPGMTWDTQFRYRNKDRRLTIRLDAISLVSSMAPGSSMDLTGKSAPVDGMLHIDVLDLAAKRCRIELRLEVRPKTIAARIYVQSLRLVRSRVERGFAQRVAQLAAEIEDRFRRGQKQP